MGDVTCLSSMIDFRSWCVLEALLCLCDKEMKWVLFIIVHDIGSGERIILICQ